jgi:hypothetical protein
VDDDDDAVGARSVQLGAFLQDLDQGMENFVFSTSRTLLEPNNDGESRKPRPSQQRLQ